MVRRLRYSDWPAVTDLLMQAANGKATPETCRSVAQRCATRNHKRDGSYGLICDTGFLYGEERNLFDLATSMDEVEVHFLVGRNCAKALLAELRRLTHKRIVLHTRQILGRERALARLLSSMGLSQSGTIMEW